jgi:hypothetical protein
MLCATTVFSRSLLLLVTTITAMSFVGWLSSPGSGQEAGASGQASPTVSGTGHAGDVPIWKTSAALGNSVLSQSSGKVGIGTTTPAAKLEVNGNTQVDGNLTLSGSILASGGVPLIWAESSNFSAGLGALPPDTTGTADTAVGNSALQANTGPYNTAVGNSALQANTTGGYNTATGNYAMQYNTTGSFNTASGQAALVNSTSGYGNTAVGYVALLRNTTGSNNIGIGYYGGQYLTTGSNNIQIGNYGTASDNGTIRVGIAGTQTSAFIAGIYGQSTGLAGVPVVVDSNGNLGTVSSSRRYKEDIQDMGDTSSGLMRLRPVTFRYKKSFDDGSKPIQYGLIAEEVAEVYPDLVVRSADGQIETVKYQVLDSMLLNELQKQNATITAQKEQIRSLEDRLAKVEAALSGATVAAAAR